MKTSYRRRALNPYSLISGTLAAGGYRYANRGLASLRSKKAKKVPPPPKPVPTTKRTLKKSYASSKSTSLTKRVNKLEKQQQSNSSILIYKIDDKDTLRPSASTATYGYKDAVGTTAIELAIAQCRYFDPSNPGTLITGSLATPTYQQKIMIACKAVCVIKNNYQVPCMVTYGVAMPKEDTNITPNLARTNGLTDIGNPDSGSTLISYKDSPQFRELWRVKLKTVILKPGQQITYSKGQKYFYYDPSLQDSHGQTYQKTTRSSVFIYRCQGVVGHDSSVSTEQGILPAGIDVYTSANYIIRYNSGGASVKTIVLNEQASQTFTNSGVVSQIVADNQSYSVS